MKYGLCILSALTFSASFALPAQAATDTTETQADSATFGQELRSGFDSRINILGFGIAQSVKDDSRLNPENVLQIPRRQAELDFRPDFNLHLRQFEFGLKPRFKYARSEVDFGAGASSTDTTHHFFINEGFVRYRVTDTLLANYGRENLQWGPSSLLSPSNPFNANNGKNNPYLELGGTDYARLVAIPNSALTVSLIANTRAGRLEQNPFQSPAFQDAPFQKNYAAKLDYTGDGHYFSVIASHRQQDRNRLGFFGGWNASDALLLYTEGSAAKKANDAPPNTKNDYQVLVGGAYTLEVGPTITLEYFHNNNGCVLTRIDQCLAQQTVALDPRHPLLRRRYAMLQYVDTKIGGNMNLVVRLVRNIDDSSNQIIANLEYELGQHWQLYFVPTLYKGGRDSEFGSLLRRSAFLGASYTF